MKSIKAVFRPGSKRISSNDCITQWDYGQNLIIDGLDLPYSFEVDFSLDPYNGVSEPQIGTDNTVRIPDNLMETGEPIYAFIFLHHEQDDGETEYRITIPVEKRPARGLESPDPVQQSVIDQTITALSAGVEAAQAARDAILNLGVEIDMLEPGESGWIHKSIDEETGAVTMTFGIPYGKKGDQGIPGEPGTPGLPGSNGKDGKDGLNGVTYTPSLSNGILSWTNNGDLPNPNSFNIVEAVLEALPSAEEGRF